MISTWEIIGIVVAVIAAAMFFFFALRNCGNAESARKKFERAARKAKEAGK